MEIEKQKNDVEVHPRFSRIDIIVFVVVAVAVALLVIAVASASPQGNVFSNIVRGL